ncbi:MAG: pyridoxamine 5'-phosphate oxidase [Flavobacteriales bacterium]|nr:pyridoxamine 5'-phosphate oxidase [Flavobacteriales bacterium]
MSIDAYINSSRRDFSEEGLTEDLPENPIVLLKRWMALASDNNIVDFNAFVLSTVIAESPRSRVVLLREITDKGIIFYTNYNSAKGQEIGENHNVGANIFWPSLNRQIRITGQASKISGDKSDIYFNSRPRESRLAAWASDQSQTIPSRTHLENKFKELEKEFENKEVTRPEHWGGFEIEITEIEFWLGRPNRMHDRISYQKGGDESWVKSILSP